MADAETIGRRYATDFWNDGDESVVDEYFASDHEYHDPRIPGLPTGPEGAKQRRAAYMSVVPDGKVTLEDVVATDDAVVLRWNWDGTMGGEFLGAPPTNRPVHTSGMHILKLRGEKVAETWVEYDSAGIFDQMGVISLPG